jgi:hypothetical protein
MYYRYSRDELNHYGVLGMRLELSITAHIEEDTDDILHN